MLLAATAIALAWANSPWSESYHHVWELPIAATFGPASFRTTLHHLINDGLMAVFFCLVGLEIKREVIAGELASLRTASLPMIAALGGMIVPASIYALVNLGGAGMPGWGVPMATDIAFALGVLALLGDRVPVGLNLFVAALAIVDDIGAVLVIAVFYSSGVSWTALGAAAMLLLVAVGLNRAGEFLDAAKLGILVASALAGIVGTLVLRNATGATDRAKTDAGPDDAASPSPS